MADDEQPQGTCCLSAERDRVVLCGIPAKVLGRFVRGGFFGRVTLKVEGGRIVYVEEFTGHKS